MPRYTSVPAAAALVAIAGTLAGCSDSKTPSKDVFRAALDPVVRDAFCQPLDVMTFEIQGQDKKGVFPVVTSRERTLYGPGADGTSVAMLDAAAGAGLVTRTTVVKPARWEGSDRPFVQQPLILYAPTEKGAPYFRPVERKATKGMVTISAACAAKAEVVDVVRWTEPTNFGGHRVSRVTYSYRGVDPISLMSQQERGRLAELREATLPFELQSDGWHPMAR